MIRVLFSYKSKILVFVFLDPALGEKVVAVLLFTLAELARVDAPPFRAADAVEHLVVDDEVKEVGRNVGAVEQPVNFHKLERVRIEAKRDRRAKAPFLASVPRD